MTHSKASKALICEFVIKDTTSSFKIASFNIKICALIKFSFSFCFSFIFSSCFIDVLIAELNCSIDCLTPTKLFCCSFFFTALNVLQYAKPGLMARAFISMVLLIEQHLTFLHHCLKKLKQKKSLSLV